ncbi:ATP-binding protein [Rhizobium ruizarguesonis]|nr:ATP-binding protein [Rhizobium leguminosarum]
MVTTTGNSPKHYSDALHSLVIGDAPDGEEAIALLTDEYGKFVVDEGPLHDYKDEYPFSSSDHYFGGILRLICAFHNSYGGVIIFGVHDKTRLGGKNRVLIDSEKINRKLREILCRPLEISTSRVETAGGPVDLLIVPPRWTMIPPIYTMKDVGDYKKGKIYLRRGAEVLTATGGDLSFLYGHRASAFGEQETVDLSVPSSLPPSPATIEEFVGRFTVVERIIAWITASRDPRLFLWGQGGSGKSTIAYECATLLADSGGTLKNKNGNKLDRVLYISGKATYLDPTTGKIQNTASRDFDNAEDIYRTILALSNWTEPEKLETYTKDELLDALAELFELEAQLIVIDDVDTLTTSKKDAGMEELFVTLTRARSGTKVLYTQRGFPSFAPNASVEVPGLTDGEFQQFLALCCTKFKVPPPGADDANSIKMGSERRPLAIETMVGMRRLTATYTDALRRWKENSSEARQYLFNREYQQLNTDDRGRHLLATLAIFNAPQSAETLRSILQFSPEQLEDAIAETRDMFLTVTSSDGIKGDLFSIGPATRLFIEENSKQLDRYSSIEARVQHFKDASKHTPASFIPLIDRAARNLRTGNINDAISLLSRRDLPSAFKEHPEVQALLGESYAMLTPPNVTDARKCFESAFSLGHRRYQMYLAWLELEKTNRTEFKNGIEVCMKVVGSTGFDAKTKASFLRRLAKYQSMLANETELASPQESVRLRQDSVINNLKAYILARLGKDVYIHDYKERVDLSITIALRRCLRVDDIDGFFDLFESLLSVDQVIDEFGPVLIERVKEVLTREIANKRALSARLARLNGKIGQAAGVVFSKEASRTFSGEIKSLQNSISEAAKS